DERTREVGQTHSTGEVSEQDQNNGGGGDGGKGSGQGEPEPAKRVPDSEPGRRAQRAGAGIRLFFRWCFALSCSPSKQVFSSRKPATVLKAFSGADLSRARASFAFIEDP